MRDVSSINKAQSAVIYAWESQSEAAKSQSTAAQTSALVTDTTDLPRCAAADKILTLRNHQLRDESIGLDELNTFSEVSHNNTIELCLDRSYFVDNLLPAMRQAQDSIHMAMFKFDGGIFSNYVADLLIEKKQANPALAIRLIIDDFGSGAVFPIGKTHRLLARMRQGGIDVTLNRIITNGVEHRKVIIIDSQIAFLGGSCIADKYFGNTEFWEAYHNASNELGEEAVREATFNSAQAEAFEISPAMAVPQNHDSAIRLKGDSVQQLQTSFLQTWIFHGQSLDPTSSENEISSRYFSNKPSSIGTNNQTTAVKITHALPGGPSEMRQNLLALVNSATESLDIEIAYILVPEFTEALRQAAGRGVKIRLITNSKQSTDTKVAWASLRNNYRSLLEAGDVEIFETQTYSHVKQFVADKRLVLTSTGNPEFNSWERGFDEIVLIDDPILAQNVLLDVIEKDSQPDRAHRITHETLNAASKWQRFKIWFLALIARIFLFPAPRVAPVRNLIDTSLQSAKKDYFQPTDTPPTLSPAPSPPQP